MHFIHPGRGRMTREVSCMFSSQTKTQRAPNRNIGNPVYFVLKGAERRRQMATSKAVSIQRELGVIPKITSLK